MADMPDEIYTVEGQGTNTNVISMPPPRPVIKGKPPKTILTPVKSKERSIGERTFDAVVSGAMHSQFGFAAGQRAYLRKVKGWSEDQINDFQKKVIDNIDRINALDPAVKGSFKEDGAANIGRVATELFGNVLGGVDPTYAFGPGKTPVARVLSQMAINSGVDVGSQAIEMERGLREKYDPKQTAMNAAAGAVIQAPQEIFTHVKDLQGIKSGSNRGNYGNLIETIQDLEGGGTVDAPKTSPKGAMGPMQVMPDTARKPGLGVKPWDGKTQEDLVRVGKDYAAALNHRYNGDEAKVLAAYNGGFGMVDKLVREHGDDWWRHIPSKETRDYVANGLNKMDGIVASQRTAAPMEPDDIARIMGEDKVVDGHLVPDDELDLAVEGRMIHDDEVPLRPEDDLVMKKSEKELDDFEREARDAHQDPITEKEDVYGFDPRTTAEPKFPANDPREITPEPPKFPEATRVERGDGGTNKVMPSEDLRPAITDTDGNVHVGEEGESYADMAQKLDQPHKWDLNGYVDKDGNFIPEKDVLTPEQVSHVEKAKADTERLSKQQQLERERGIEPIDPNKGPDELLLTEETPSGGGEPPREPPAGGGGNRFEPPEGEPTMDGVFSKLSKSLKEGRRARREQNKLQTEERSRRVKEMNKARHATSGIEGLYAEKSALEGALPTKGYSGLGLSQQEVEMLFEHVKNHPSLGWLQSVRAREGLVKMLQGMPPTPSELKLLARTLPKEVVGDLLESRGLLQKIGDGVANVLNIPKALITSYDISAPLRQGVFMIRRGDFYKALVPMVRAFASEKYARAVREDIYRDALYPAMQDSGLAIPVYEGHNGGPALSDKEEAYMTNLAQKIPILGIGVRASERAFNTFVYKLRADVFKSIYYAGKATGKKWDQDALKSLSKFVNSFTGRGDLGKFNNATPLLNGIFFSPKLLKSRIDAINPKFYHDLDPFVRKEAMKDILGFAVVATTVLGLAHLASAEVDPDPRKADGWKIKVGNTRYDILGGEQQLVRLLGNVGTYAAAKTDELNRTGKIKKGHAEKTASDNIGQFLRNKESPDFSFFHDFAAGDNAIGQPFDMKQALISRGAPLPWQAWYEAADDLQKQGVPVDRSIVDGFVKTSPGLLGVSVSTYPPRPPKQKSNSKDFGKDFDNDFGNSFKDDF